LQGAQGSGYGVGIGETVLIDLRAGDGGAIPGTAQRCAAGQRLAVRQPLGLTLEVEGIHDGAVQARGAEVADRTGGLL